MHSFAFLSSDNNWDVGIYWNTTVGGRNSRDQETGSLPSRCSHSWWGSQWHKVLGRALGCLLLGALPFYMWWLEMSSSLIKMTRPVWDAVTKYHRLGGFSSKHLFLTAVRLGIQVQGRFSVHGEPLPDSHTSSSLCPHVVGRGRSSAETLMRT